MKICAHNLVHFQQGPVAPEGFVGSYYGAFGYRLPLLVVTVSLAVFSADEVPLAWRLHRNA